MRVHLSMFRPSGKWYSHGEYETAKENLWEIWDEVRRMRDERQLPGLIAGHDFYLVTIDVPEHRYNHPRLIT